MLGIYYDECQHVFGDNAKSNKVFLDSFKTMMKEPRWPMMILSGVPTLTGYIQSYEQLYELVDQVHFKTIKLGRDKNLLNRLVFAFADEANIEIEQLVTPDFLVRLDHACSGRWGLVIDTLVAAKLKGKTHVSVDDFAKQFALSKGIPKQYSPFTAPDFRKAFDPQRLLDLTR